jgi:hypothetical protein
MLVNRINTHMDNKAYEQYKATQPVVPRSERVAQEPLPALTGVEITVIAVIVTLAVYAVYRVIKDLMKKSSPKDKS